MSEQNVISDVRAAKIWVDAQATSLTELGVHLRSIEQAYRTRTGEFASVPTERPQAVQARHVYLGREESAPQGPCCRLKHDPEKACPDLIRGGNWFSEKHALGLDPGDQAQTTAWSLIRFNLIGIRL